MEAYAQVLLYAIPGFYLLIGIEFFFGWQKGDITFRSMDTIASISSGITNTLKSILGLSVVIVSYAWVVDKIAFIQFEATWLVFAICFVAIDFASYWNHRLNHAVNIFWNRHVIHHSSEEFNMACALRQEISVIWSFGALFLIPAALLGVPAKIIATVAPIHLFMQFWYHTRHVPKLGFLEYLIVTPSQHRVHHAINDIYLDKNLGAIFPWWDRLFGTFQEELDDVPCIYGVKKAPETWNPIKINFQHLWRLAQDAWRAQNWWDKLRIWFMPTGWRPTDVVEKYPIEVITDPYAYKKYDTKASPLLHGWSWFQFMFANLLTTHMLIHIAKIGFPSLFLYGGFIFLMIYAYTELMDRSRNAIWFELIKSLYGFSLLYTLGGWFGVDQLVPGGTYFMAMYLITSVLVVAAFTNTELKKEQVNLQSL